LTSSVVDGLNAKDASIQASINEIRSAQTKIGREAVHLLAPEVRERVHSALVVLEWADSRMWTGRSPRSVASIAMDEIRRVIAAQLTDAPPPAAYDTFTSLREDLDVYHEDLAATWEARQGQG
jgi:hypothetical protein